MNKIDIKITSAQLVTVVAAFDGLSTKPTDRTGKVIRSVVDILSVRFGKKFLEIKSKIDLFNAKTKHKFSLEYYEAHALELFLRGIIDHVPKTTYDKNYLRKLVDDLNQKLA